MNYMKEVAALLGVELNEEFKIVDENDETFLNTYKITENGLLNCDRHYECDLIGLLTGDWQVKKLPFKPKCGEYYWTPMPSKVGVVSEDYKWENLPYDYLAYYNGLCFRTKEEAEANKDKLIKIIEYYEEN